LISHLFDLRFQRIHARIQEGAQTTRGAEVQRELSTATIFRYRNAGEDILVSAPTAIVRTMPHEIQEPIHRSVGATTRFRTVHQQRSA